MEADEGFKPLPPLTEPYSCPFIGAIEDGLGLPGVNKYCPNRGGSCVGCIGVNPARGEGEAGSAEVGTILGVRGKDGWLYAGVGRSWKSCRRGDRMSSGLISGAAATTSTAGIMLSSGRTPKTVLKSLRNIDNTGAGMLRVGEKTMPTVPN